MILFAFQQIDSFTRNAMFFLTFQRLAQSTHWVMESGQLGF